MQILLTCADFYCKGDALQIFYMIVAVTVPAYYIYLNQHISHATCHFQTFDTRTGKLNFRMMIAADIFINLNIYFLEFAKGFSLSS